MGQVLHKRARTTEEVRREIQQGMDKITTIFYPKSRPLLPGTKYLAKDQKAVIR